MKVELILASALIFGAVYSSPHDAVLQRHFDDLGAEWAYGPVEIMPIYSISSNSTATAALPSAYPSTI